MPFKLRIHDDDPRHPQGRELGTVWVEIPHDEIERRVKSDIPGQHWEYVAQEEKYAAEFICADLSCSIDIDALHTSPVTAQEGPSASLEELVAETLANRHGYTVIGEPAMIYRDDAAAVLAALGLSPNGRTEAREALPPVSGSTSE